MVKLFTIGISFFLCLLSSSLLSQQIAFPGAEGFGKYAKGGRGGRIVEVTNLKDITEFGTPIPGSLRAALNTEGEDPITIVFRVSGIIELKAELKSGRSNMTIAGQTAPGDGICIKNASIKLSGNDLIVRYIRFRPGDELREQPSGLNIENARNIIVDHCSMSWAIEENTGFYDNVNTTVQWCIISEGLYDSYHSKGPRGYGGQWGGQYSSYHHNLLAHNRSRSPRINGSRAHDTIALVDFRNNVIFNWGSSGAIYGGEEEIPNGKNETNFINNYYKPGPATPDDLYFAAPSVVTDGNVFQGYGAWYFSGNYMEGVTGGMNDDNWLGVDVDRVESVENIKSPYKFPVAPIETQTAQEAYELVLENAGAILPERDTVDKRIVAEVRGEVEVIGNGIIDSQTEVGGWPEYESLTPLPDSDKDGMPDSWESENGLDPNDAEDGKIITENGYSNLEVYLHSITGSQHGTEPDPPITGGLDNHKAMGFQLYPNPSKDKIFFHSGERIKKIELFNLEGNRVSVQNSIAADENNFIAVGHLKSGVYIVRAVFYDGQTVERKVSKQ